MLTNRQTFDAGETVSDAVAAILRADVDWSALPASTPPHIRRLLQRCLQKDPQKRRSRHSRPSRQASRRRFLDLRLTSVR
jgi:hypothetical protein